MCQGTTLKEHNKHSFSSLRWHVPGLHNCYGMMTVYPLPPSPPSIFVKQMSVEVILSWCHQ